MPEDDTRRSADLAPVPDAGAGEGGTDGTAQLPGGGSSPAAVTETDRAQAADPDEDADEEGRDEPAALTAAETEQRLLARLLGRRTLTLGTARHDRIWAWAGPLLVTALAAVVRFADLSRPRQLVFDETYYVKNAYTLLMVGFDAAWPKDANDQIVAGTYNVFLNHAEYTVHPPLGKWLIAAGIWAGGGMDNTWAWRLGTAVAGVLAVFIVARTGRRLFGSTAAGVVAGGLVAIDGLAIVMSRTSLLDNFLMLFTVIAFSCLVVDREQHRRRLASQAAGIIAGGGTLPRWWRPAGARWWRLAAFISIGAACGVKWSGLYVFAAFGLLTVAWDWGARRQVAGTSRGLTWLVRDALPAGIVSFITVPLVYLSTWWAWFAYPESWNRLWYQDHPGVYPSWLPGFAVSAMEALRSFWDYHQDMYRFHRGLDSEHTYMSNPWGWPLQLRPTSFHWNNEAVSAANCGSERCVAAVTSLGNPLIWWLGSAVLLCIIALCVWWAGRGLLGWWRREPLRGDVDLRADGVPGAQGAPSQLTLLAHADWRAVAVLVGFAAGWVPWLFLAERTIFTFYAIAIMPFMALAIAWLVAVVFESIDDEPDERVIKRRATAIIGSVIAVVVLVSFFFYPIWTAMPVRYDFWHIHMWLPSWI